MNVNSLEEFIETNESIVDNDNLALAHFGILGMHWGDRNGPPYPLSGDQHTKEQVAMAEATGTTVGKSSGKGSVGNMTKAEVKQAKKLQKQQNAQMKKARLAKAAKAKEQQNAEKRKVDREKAVREGNAEKVKEYFSEYSTQELKDAVDRIGYLQKINEAIPKKKSTWQQIDSAVKKVDLMTGAVNTGIKAYNTYASVSNTFNTTDDKLPIINTGGGGGKKKKKK